MSCNKTRLDARELVVVNGLELSSRGLSTNDETKQNAYFY